jgi:hypothetical protein
MHLIFSEDEKKEITGKIREYYRENGESMPFDLDEYEVFMIGELGDPLLENRKDGSLLDYREVMPILEKFGAC